MKTKTKTLKQSSLCNLMAGISIIFGLAIFVSGIVTSQEFIKVANLNNVQAQIYKYSRTLVTTTNYSKDMVRSYTQEGNGIYMDMYKKAISGESNTVDTIETIKQLVNDPKGQGQLSNVVSKVNYLDSMEKKAIELVEANKLEEAQKVMFGKDYGITIDGLKTAINEFELGMDRGIGAIIQQQSKNIMYLGNLIMILCVLLIAVQVSNAIATKKLIIAPVIKLKDSMIAMNEGHLSGNVDVLADKTEIGELAGAMYAMRSRINEYIKEISLILHCISQKNMIVDVKNEYVGDFASIKSSLTMIIESLSRSFESLGNSTDGIYSSAERVSNSASALAEGAAMQSSSVEGLSASIAEISEQIKNTAANAETAKTLATTSEENLNISNKRMSHMVQAISEISVSSAQIGKIIKTIEDIAFQTNILALNAAVEAARAGSAGKGFAIVADEVRNLANKSSEAAKQTNILIENSVHSVQSGVQIADETACALTEVVVSSRAMADLVSKISGASSEQALAITQINMGVEQISSVVQTNSAASEQSATTSEELSNQAQAMKKLVSSFKIKSSTVRESKNMDFADMF